MNDSVLKLKQMRRAMQPYVLMLYEMIIEMKPENVLELGVRQAQSSRTILSALEENKKGMLTSIDLQDRNYRFTDDFKHLLPYWNMVVGNSHDKKTFDKVSDKQYDLLLVDAGHDFSDVLQDYEMYSLLVKSECPILFHDIYNKDCGVPKFWEELEVKEKFGFRYGFAGMGIITKE